MLSFFCLTRSALVLPAMLLCGSLTAHAQASAVKNVSVQRAPVMVTNFGVQGYRANGTSKGSFWVPGIRAILDAGLAMNDDQTPEQEAARRWWYHGVGGIAAGYGGSGKVSYDAFIAAGASYSVAPLVTVAALYEPLGFWVTPIQGIAGSGLDLRMRIWRAQVEYGWRRQGMITGVLNGEIRQKRYTVRLFPRAGIMLAAEMYPAPVMSEQGNKGKGTCTNFIIGVGL